MQKSGFDIQKNTAEGPAIWHHCLTPPSRVRARGFVLKNQTQTEVFGGGWLVMWCFFERCVEDTDIYKSTQILDADTLDSADMLPSAFKECGEEVSLKKLVKYREIIYAIFVFLIIDTSVLVSNFYISFQIAKDVLSINLSGRQRTLSQQIAKSLYAVKSADAENNVVVHDATSELGFSVDLFDATLVGFDQGAYVSGGDMKSVWLNAVATEKGRKLIEAAKEKWGIYKEILSPILKNDFTEEQLNNAFKYVKNNNIKLMRLMNQLTAELEEVTNRRVRWLRMAQGTGMALVLLNFIFIMNRLIRQLSVEDVKLEEIHRESEEILNGVQVGLFLITPDLRLGKQISAFSKEIFCKLEIRPGANFLDLLLPLLPPKIINDVRRYVGLLFEPYVNESIMRNMNPLSEVEVLLKNGEDIEQKRHLAFRFARIMDGGQGALGRVRRLLVAVQDVTDLHMLQEKSRAEKKRTRKAFYRLLDALRANPALLREFLENAQSVLQNLRDLLQWLLDAKVGEEISGKLKKMEADIQALREKASGLPLDLLVSQLHDLELQLINMRYRDEVGFLDHGKGLQGMFITLDEIDEKLHTLSAIIHEA